MTERENYLRNVSFGYPEAMPITMVVNPSSLIAHKQDLEAVMARFPAYFPDFKPGSIDYSRYGNGTCDIWERDAWGYDWHYSLHGIEGCVCNHPLDDWSKLAAYSPPDNLTIQDRGGAQNWDMVEKLLQNQHQNGLLTKGSLVHGFLFLRLQYLRGFENLMVDMALDDENLPTLISLIDEQNLNLVNKYCSLGVDVMELPEDLGAEKSMLISRDMFRKYILPSYQLLTKPCHAAGVKTAIHSDGYILDILEDLLEVGMDIINPQDLCNGIDNLARTLKGKVCIRLDLDRVHITPRGTRAEIFELIEEEIKVLGSEKGGLEFIYGMYPPTGPDQLAYICEAFDTYKGYWFSS